MMISHIGSCVAKFEDVVEGAMLCHPPHPRERLNRPRAYINIGSPALRVYMST